MGRSKTNCDIRKYGNIKIDVHSHGAPCQVYDFDSHDEQNKNAMCVLWCNISKWGAQANRYDLLFPIKEEKKHEKSFKYNSLKTTKHSIINAIGKPTLPRTT
eukprot:10574873-Heterocapsa_arctica.AAC.1